MASLLVKPSKILLVGGTAFRTFRCVWMLQELQVPYEHATRARPQSKESKLHHPTGKIPSLVVNGGEYTIFESSAINTYLGDTHSSRPLVPKPLTLDRVKYDQTVSFIMTELDSQGVWIHRKHESLSKIFGAAPEAVVEAKRQFDAANQALCHQLDPYLLGSDFTAADILYVHCLDWAKTIGWDDAFDPKLACYLDQCTSRPAYIRTVELRAEEERSLKEYLKQRKGEGQSKL